MELSGPQSQRDPTPHSDRHRLIIDLESRMMAEVDDPLLRISIAQEHESCRDLFAVVSEVFPTQARLPLVGKEELPRKRTASLLRKPQGH